MNSDAAFLFEEDHALNQSYIINDSELWRGELQHMPLTTRGWVLQEEVLAPRTIYFGARQVLWDCGQGRACETYPSMQVYETHSFKRTAVEIRLPQTHHDEQRFLQDDVLGPIISVVRLVS